MKKPLDLAFGAPRDLQLSRLAYRAARADLEELTPCVRSSSERLTFPVVYSINFLRETAESWVERR